MYRTFRARLVFFPFITNAYSSQKQQVMEIHLKDFK
jgi:hypothetical protein